MTRYRWYLTARAVRQYLAICGWPDDDGGPIWGRAEGELAEHCATARHHRTQRNGLEQYRTARVPVAGGERRTRLDFLVSTAIRPEGPLPQLVEIIDRGSRR